MSELYFQKPPDEHISATYGGMTFQEFVQLEDDEANAMIAQENVAFREVWLGNEEPEEQVWNEVMERNNTLSHFLEWRRHGLPDQNLTRDEFVDRVRHYVDIRRTQDPAYGTLSEEDFSHLNEAELELASFIIDEVGTLGVAQPVINHAGFRDATERLGVTCDQLVEKGILERYATESQILWRAGTGYVLAGKYADWALARFYPED